MHPLTPRSCLPWQNTPKGSVSLTASNQTRSMATNLLDRVLVPRGNSVWRDTRHLCRSCPNGSSHPKLRAPRP